MNNNLLSIKDYETLVLNSTNNFQNPRLRQYLNRDRY